MSLPSSSKIREVKCLPRAEGVLLSFSAMASDCEILIDSDDLTLAKRVGEIASKEAWRIEDKFSRYDPKSICSHLNTQAGQQCKIDDETFQLLQFADQCYQLSNGLFDISSGALRKAWYFDGSDNVPSAKLVKELSKLVGWNKVKYDVDSFEMLAGMEIDFGGLGKEYAVDRTVILINALALMKDVPFLVNYGGDLAVSGARKNSASWQIGIEHPSFKKSQSVVVSISSGAVATSGDANRFLLKNGHRYSHILNAKTGWPVKSPPNAITVAAPKCIQAGFLATLALLQGKNAENYLTQHQIKHWSLR